MSGRGRFWGAEDSDDSSSTGSTSSSEAGKAGAGAGRAAPAAAGRFAAYESDSESDDGGNRVARSVKERTYEKLVTTIRGLTNQLKISNWVGAVDEFEKVQAVYDRNVNVLAREGPPRAYLRAIAQLEDAANAISRGDTKKMSQTNARAITRLKMTLKKVAAADTPLGAQLAAFRAAPDRDEDDEAAAALAARKAAAADDSDEEEIMIGSAGVKLNRPRRASASSGTSTSSSDSSSGSSSGEGSSSDDDSASSTSSSEAGAAAGDRWKKKPAATAAAAAGAGAGKKGGEDEDSESDWGESSDSESDSDEEDESLRGLTGRARWVKRAGAVKDDATRKDEKQALSKARALKQGKARQANEAAAAVKAAENTPAAIAAAAAAAAAAIDVASLEGKVTDASGIIGRDWSREGLEKRVREELASRGRKGADPRAVAARLTALADVSIRFGPATSIPTLMAAVTARFDTAKGLDVFLERAAWKRSARDLGTVLSILEAHPTLRLAPVRQEELEHTMALQREAKRKAAAAAAAATGDAPSAAEEAAAAAAAAAPAAADPAHVIRVVGDLSLLLERLQDEYTKSLQHTDPHRTEYVVRIGDEQGIAGLADRAFDWYKRVAAEAAAAVKPGSAAAAALPGAAPADPVTDAAAAAKAASEAASRLAILRVEHMHYKHDAVAAQLRIVAAAADKRAEVAAIAAAAAAQAMAEARASALDAHRAAAAASTAAGAASTGAGATGSGAPPTPAKAGAASASGAGAGAGAAGATPVDAAAATAALAAAADQRVVGDAAAVHASDAAIARGKRSLSVAAGVVARAVVAALAAREGSLLSAGAVATSRSGPDMDLLADAEAAGALAAAEAAGTDLGDLSTAVVTAQAGIVAGAFDSARQIGALAAYVYAQGDGRSRVRAVLCHVYHHALHDRYSAGKDLLLMSRLQEHVTGMDVKVQVAYNRALVALGIAAFRLGLWAEAHDCLNDICGSGHARELLAQGLSQARMPGQDRDEALDREERRRLVPYHMHLNADLADACALTAAMLLEVPNIAAAEHDPRRREISRAYRRHLDAIDSKTFVGPPESTRDSIMMAGLALAEGDWRRATALLGGIRAWGLWASRGLEGIRARLEAAVKEAGLVTYLHTYAAYYDSISLAQLADQFDLPQRAVGAVAARMIYNGEVAGRLEEPTASIVLQRSPPTRLQALALEFADRVAEVVEGNERALAVRTGQDRWGERDGDRGFRGGAGGDGRYRRHASEGYRGGGGAGGGGRPPYGGGEGGGGGYRGGGRGGRGGFRGGMGGGRFPGGFGSGRREYKPRGY